MVDNRPFWQSTDHHGSWSIIVIIEQLLSLGWPSQSTIYITQYHQPLYLFLVFIINTPLCHKSKYLYFHFISTNKLALSSSSGQENLKSSSCKSSGGESESEDEKAIFHWVDRQQCGCSIYQPRGQSIDPASSSQNDFQSTNFRDSNILGQSFPKNHIGSFNFPNQNINIERDPIKVVLLNLPKGPSSYNSSTILNQLLATQYFLQLRVQLANFSYGISIEDFLSFNQFVYLFAECLALGHFDVLSVGFSDFEH